MGRPIGVLMIISGWIGGIALWLVLVIMLSILPFVDAVTADPVDSHAVAWAVIWFFLSNIIASVVVLVLIVLGGLIGAASD